MSKSKKIFELAREVRAEFDVPVFPVRLEQEATGKWTKKPLVKWSRISGDPRDTHWNGSNALGVPMGRRSGLLAIDLDDYKPGSEATRWMEARRLPPTRTHGTASGGRHLLYRLPEGLELGNHAPPVTGLDIRGNGGFIVWADIEGLYSVLDDRQPVMLPNCVCAELQSLKRSSGSPLSDACLPDFLPVNQAALEEKLTQLLKHPKGASLRERFSGSSEGLGDCSRSGRDMSVAGLLARRGCTYSEIVQILLVLFAHGVAARDGWDDRTERLAKRCAHRAVRDVERRSEQRRRAMVQKLSELTGRPFRPTALGQENAQ